MGKRKRTGDAPRKLVVEFDAAARRDYVLGMSKRKKERRQAGMQRLRDRVHEEKLEQRKERKEMLIEEHKRKREIYARQKAAREAMQAEDEEDDEDDEDGEDDEDENKEEDASAVLGKLTGKGSKVKKTQVDDDFSKKMFGSSTVTITTTKLDDSDVERDSDDEDEDGGDEDKNADRRKRRAKPSMDESIPVLGAKNSTTEVTKAQKMLQRLSSKTRRNKLRSAGLGGKKPKAPGRGKRGRKGTTAGERRRRSKQQS